MIERGENKPPMRHVLQTEGTVSSKGWRLSLTERRESQEPRVVGAGQSQGSGEVKKKTVKV